MDGLRITVVLDTLDTSLFIRPHETGGLIFFCPLDNCFCNVRLLACFRILPAHTFHLSSMNVTPPLFVMLNPNPVPCRCWSFCSVRSSTPHSLTRASNLPSSTACWRAGALRCASSRLIPAGNLRTGMRWRIRRRVGSWERGDGRQGRRE